MKKLTALFLALLLCLSFAACDSGADKQPAIDSFNNASVLLGEVCDAFEADPDSMAELEETLYQMTESMTKCKEMLESDQPLTEEKVTELVGILDNIATWCEVVKEEYGI